jgi:transcription elongation GreA/GreB family factor
LPAGIDKEALRRAVVAKLEAGVARQAAAADSARDEATDAESRSEGKYDMRGQTAAYLAAGQSRLAAETAEAAAAFRALPLSPEAPAVVGLGALATLAGPGGETVFWLGPAAGGLELEFGGVAVTVITPASTLGRSLLGLRAGDAVAQPGRAALRLVRVE